MNLNHLTDNELIDYVIKYEDDPVKIRLATYMDSYPGAILDDLEHAGMDPTFCNFRSIINDSEYLPGQYITHLEEEVRYLQEQLYEAQKEIEELKPMSVAELIATLRQETLAEKYRKEDAERKRWQAEKEKEDMKSKLDMWAILNR